MITLIAAAAENNALGKDNDLVWHLPDDFKRFKQLTSGHFIIMGRKTFESFPKPLPNRTHIIITRQKNYAEKINCESCIVVDSIENAIAKTIPNEESFIIGGGEIYKQSLPFADKIELTRVHGIFEADAFFPALSLEEWKEIEKIDHVADEKNTIPYSFSTLERI